MLSCAAVLPVQDVGTSVSYFVETLGFRAVATFPPGEAIYGIVQRGDVAVHLQGGWTSRADVRAEHETDLYVYVDDADELFAEYDAAGVTLYRGLYDNDYGMRDFCIETPDGHRVAFGSPLAGG
ncbi:MAG: VOC family protein [Actinomycetota bacterium]